ncbi:MAG: hypothetical protein K8T25_03205 [Planctomycetia bacterium]|nr:hypothetical protein [Planctomycetia bacterium]
MTILIGIDIGTTTITALAFSPDANHAVSVQTVANDARLIGSSDIEGRSEWDAQRIAERSLACLAALVKTLGPRAKEIAGIGLTGQQHGAVVLDAGHQPLTPFINWQDQRCAEVDPATGRTFIEMANARLGESVSRRTGCPLATGFLGATLFWLARHDLLPASSKACFIADYLGTVLTGEPPATDPTMAASGGLCDVARRNWDAEAIEALGLSPSQFPTIREANERFGIVSSAIAQRTGIAAGVPVFAPMGDQQASFLGSVGDRLASVHLNVGTGAQLAVWTDAAPYIPSLELRPFPLTGNLLTGAVLCGGWSYQLLDRFFRQAGEKLMSVAAGQALYDQMNRLAAEVPAGSDGLVCEPLFAGTRAEPRRRAAWHNVSPDNFTPGHFARALLEGMARLFHAELTQVRREVRRPLTNLIGTGNGLRENPLLRSIVAAEFGLPMSVPRHREEAALGAALMAAVGTGVFRTLDETGAVLGE